jgi:monoamine oxidase
MNKPFARALREYQRAGERWDSETAVEIYPKSVAERLSETHAPAWVQARMRGLRGLFLADPDRLSVLALIEFLADIQSDHEQGDEGDSLRIVGGNDRVATLAAKRLRQPPRFRTVLRRIRQTARGIVASVETPSSLDEISADYSVITLPATLTRDVIFEPGLPETQWTAITRLRYGTATRLAVQFSTRFWNRKNRPHAFGTDQPYGAVWDANEEQGARPGILSFLAGGTCSSDLQSIVKSDGLEGLMKRLKWLGRPSKILASRMVTWEDDPWARGGYAYFDPSYDPRWRGWLKRPAGRIFFAGEHTSARWLGYINGAVESGERAAEEIEAARVTRRGTVD